MGRPSKLTPELTANIIGKILNGWFPTVAARACGINKSTYSRWMEKGRRKNGPKELRDFCAQVDAACAEARGKLEARIYHEEGKTALAWLKSGPGREDWGDKSEVNIGFDQNRPLSVKGIAAPTMTFAQAIVMVEQLKLEMDPEKILEAERIEQGEVQ